MIPGFKKFAVLGAVVLLGCSLVQIQNSLAENQKDESYLGVFQGNCEFTPDSVPVPDDLEIYWDGTSVQVICPSYPEGIVDISLSYSVIATSFLRFLGNQITVVHEQHQWDYGLSGGLDQFHYVPVFLDEKGQGELELLVHPTNLAQLEVHEVQAIKLFPTNG